LRPGIVTFRRQTVAQNEIAPSALCAEERLSFQRTASRKRAVLRRLYLTSGCQRQRLSLFGSRRLDASWSGRSKSSPPAGK